MSEPQNTTYSSFSTSIEKKTIAADEGIKNAKKKLSKSWSRPADSLESSCLDADKIKDKFQREDIQKAYTEYLKSDELPPVEATTIKFQNGFIAADEQAYRIRHYSLPRALAAGYLDNKRWANGFIKEQLESRIQAIQELAQKDYENRFTKKSN